MKAAVLNEIPGSLRIEDVSIDSPGPREVLVRTVAAGLCHSDLHFMEGTYTTAVPAVLGHESAGVVEAVGSMVDYVEPGDHVITCLAAFCGHCEDCLGGHPARCQRKGADLVRRPADPPRLSRGDETLHQFLHCSSFAEQLLVHEHALVKDQTRHATGEGGAHRLWCDHRSRRHLPHRPGRSRAPTSW